MTDDRLRRASKKLSWLLRHGAIESDLRMDPAGWAASDDVLRITGMSAELLDDIVRTNDKARLQVQGDQIRATQGHSPGGTPVQLDALEESWAERTSDESIWHGTNTRALAGIAESGLIPKARTHVHMTSSLESHVGKRAQVDVMLEIDPILLRELGARIFESPNGVLLARRVPRAAIVDLLPQTRRTKKNVDEIRALFGFAR